MQFLFRKPCLLVIVLVFITLTGWAQRFLPPAPGTRAIDSIQMLMNGPSSYSAALINHKPLFEQQTAPTTETLRNIIAGKMQSPAFTVCFDTSGRYFLEHDSLFFYVYADARSADGSILITGQYVNRFSNAISGGFLMKCNDNGTAQWTLLYNSSGQTPPYTYCYYYELAELSDGSVLMAGKINNPVSGNYDMLITHTDNAGNIIWSKTYASRLWQGFNGSGDYFYIMHMQQDPGTGDIFFTGPHWENGINVTRMKITDGSLLWSKYYGGVSFDFNVPFGIDIRANDLLVFSKYTGGIINMSRINKNTGDTLANRYLKLTNLTSSYLAFSGTEKLVKLDNGHYALSGRLYRYFISIFDKDSISPLAHAGIAEVDDNFNFIKAWYFGNNIPSNYSNTRVTVRKDGSGLFSMLSNYTSEMLYVQFRNDQILKQRSLSYKGESMVAENRSLLRADGSDLIIKHLRNFSTDKGKIEFLNLHLSDTASTCLGLDENSSFTRAYQMEPGQRFMDSVKSNDFKESINKAITVTNESFTYTPACRQISYCDTLSMLANADTICITTPLSFTVRKSPACGASVFLEYDTSKIQSYARVNDSLYRFNFKSAGLITIYGSIFGCTLLKDSVKIVVMAAPGKINLGPDTAICPGNTIVLHAKPGYSSYRWQDGSVDSVFSVKQPGLYYVRAADGCGNIFADTVNVTAHAPIPFDLGPDSSLCESDSITLKAPASFINYKWSPNYRINSLSSQSVIVSPLVDTLYHVRAEKTPGCFVEDSVRVRVNHAPTINLGADKSFCSGDSLVLNAGMGFTSYAWSNGKTGQFTTVYNAGNYSVSASTQQGCKSADTMRIINVFTNPVVNLGTDSVICTGTPRILDAGSFKQYSWNTGSTAGTITITQTGLYTVAVTDNNNCKGYGTITINKAVNPAANFLPPDTSICSYGKLVLQATGNFGSYLWNTSAVTASVTVTAAGTYWLEVKDHENCRGRDSIVLTAKDCMFGFYIPNAFSPGHDGKNDLFRPLIFGSLLQYEFIIYNRFGQVVFRTRELRKGWDGSVAGSAAPQSTNVFAWTCRYQLENEPAKFEKGMVLLLK